MKYLASAQSMQFAVGTLRAVILIIWQQVTTPARVSYKYVNRHLDAPCILVATSSQTL